MTTYAVEITTETPLPLTNAQLEDLATRAAEERGWTLSRRADGPGWTVVVWLGADTVAHATQDAIGQVAAWSSDPVVAVHARTEDAYAAAADLPTIPDLVSASDAAEILGVSRQRIYQLRSSHPEFPAPLAEVALGPIWARDTIEWFNQIWERKPGRPSKATITEVPQNTRGRDRQPRLRA